MRSTFSYRCDCQSTFSYQPYEKLKMLGGADTRIRVFIGLQVDKFIFIFYFLGQSLRAPVFGEVGVGFQLNFRFSISDSISVRKP